ncbi:hypothetical protein [Pelotalea chapellei]|uniref:Uncharacterized protein n=1 Tax=Pelotalea chapellei TaxID=44671 RepID=A0ABS5UD80_9BACT|nr:hypothetical protein [Pelotalea chapellei]MBT1073598.1 hypothetical protein [Pelotalea chapellei]
MTMTIDTDRMETLAHTPFQSAGPEDLWRKGSVFFVGGNLPLYETLETMFESFCMESTQLFHLTFGDQARFRDNLEMARQIKKNFNARLIVQVNYPLSKIAIEHIYAAGVNILDIPTSAALSDADNVSKRESLKTAHTVFPRWSTASTVLVGEYTDESVRAIDSLLADHILPLVQFSGQNTEVQSSVSHHLAEGWQRHHVVIQPLLPLIQLTTPLTPGEQGRFRGLLNRIIERHDLVRSDLHRHLRVKHPEDSLDSAGL